MSIRELLRNYGASESVILKFFRCYKSNLTFNDKLDYLISTIKKIITTNTYEPDQLITIIHLLDNLTCDEIDILYE